MAQTLGRYGPHRTLLLSLPRALVIGEKEKPVLLQRTSQGNAKDISQQLVGEIRLAASRFRSFDKEVVGAGDGVAVVFVEGTVETVCPALGDQRHLGSRTGTLIGVVVGRCYPELLDRIKSGRQHRSKGIPVGLVVHVDTVERDVALIAARTIHGAIARVLVPVDIRTV